MLRTKNCPEIVVNAEVDRQIDFYTHWLKDCYLLRHENVLILFILLSIHKTFYCAILLMGVYRHTHTHTHTHT